jgi:3'-phosphoadenosine 5'-phosphosulfate (PAPS) 3'-phosphatase
MKIILFGASGYVGLPVGEITLQFPDLKRYLTRHSVALALIRNGHVVVGVSRNPKVSKMFRANESKPIVIETASLAIVDKSQSKSSPLLVISWSRPHGKNTW